MSAQDRRGRKDDKAHDFDASNRLPLLAEEIRQAHAGVKEAAQTAAERAIEAGHALIEAKGLVKHGEWLPWLKQHCRISERTAQLYMKIVRLGLKSETVADLGVKAASKVVSVIKDPHYDPFHHCDREGKRQWILFACFLNLEGWHPDDVGRHCEWVLQRQFKSPEEWLGKEGRVFRSQWGLREPSLKFKELWDAFLSAHPDTDEADLPPNWSIYAGDDNDQNRSETAKKTTVHGGDDIAAEVKRALLRASPSHPKGGCDE